MDKKIIKHYRFKNFKKPLLIWDDRKITYKNKEIARHYWDENNTYEYNMISLKYYFLREMEYIDIQEEKTKYNKRYKNKKYSSTSETEKYLKACNLIY